MIVLIKTLIGCVAVLFLTVVYIAYAVLWPVRTLTINSTQPIHLLQRAYHPGEFLQYTLDYCKYTDTYPVVHRWLVDGQVITLTDSAGLLPKGCHTVVTKTARIPDTVNPGRYYLSVDNQYVINPFHSEDVRYITEQFDVVEGESASTSAAVTVIK